MKNTKIEWCDATVNPVIGCKRGCPYCYAKRLNDRFGFIKEWDKPVFFLDRLKVLYQTKKPTVFFMDSMSDIEYWSDAAFKNTMLAIALNTHHHYIFLTKNTSPFMTDSRFNGKILFQGKSVTRQSELSDIASFDFYSIEPILEEITLSCNRFCQPYLKAVIVGAETGHRQGKVIPKKEWIDKLVHDCDQLGIPIFMKNSLKELMGSGFRQDELPWYKGLKQ